MNINIDMNSIMRGARFRTADIHEKNRKIVRHAIKIGNSNKNKRNIAKIAEDWGITAPTLHALLSDRPYSPSNIVVVKLRLCGVNITNVTVEKNGSLFYLDVLSIVHDLKPTELCKILGVDYYNSYVKWRNKKATPLETTIVILADFFAIDHVLLKTELVNYYGYERYRKRGVQVPKLSRYKRYGLVTKKEEGILNITPKGGSTINKGEIL